MRKLSVFNPWSFVPNNILDEDWGEMDSFGSDVQMDVYEQGDNVVVEVKAPGFTKDEIDVSIESGQITIVGNAEEEIEEKDEKKKYYRKEIRKNSFTRSCALPVEIVPDKTKAKFKNGVLKIVLPKSEEAKPKKIHVDVD
jgi:HSP20 family protein